MSHDLITNPTRVLPTLQGRRQRVIFVPQDYVLGLLQRVSDSARCVRVGYLPQLPDTTRIAGVWCDYARAAFAFVVEDDSFDLIAPNAQAPEMEIKWSVVLRDDANPA